MKFGPLDLPSLPALALPRLPLSAFRRRIVFHGVFLLLALAVVVLALTLLAEEKQRARERYEAGFRQTLSTMAAQLRHPTGQLALINADAAAPSGAGLTPVVLPFSALDYSDPFKARQAVEMSGCAVHWPDDGGQLCVGVGNSAYAGGVVYLVADLVLPPAVAREPGTLDLGVVSHAVIRADTAQGTERWVAPFEAPGDAPAQDGEGGLRGRLTGFRGEGAALVKGSLPVRDFRGWLWQEPGCALPAEALPGCTRRTLLSLRVPIESWRQALYTALSRHWPPADLNQTRLRLQWLGADGRMLFDSARADAVLPFSLQHLGSTLAGGEVLRIERLGSGAPQLVTQLRGQDKGIEVAAPWLTRLILRLPSADTRTQVQAQETVATSSGRYQLSLSGELASVDRDLSAGATRMSGFVGAMLAAIALAWLVIEVGLIRRVATLTKRAAALRYNMQDPQIERRLGELDVSDLGGRDELGILANTLATLLERIKEGARREHIRNEQERDMWHAVGHEIMSPLQSLMVLHGDAADPSHRYVHRMQQAVRVLYGSASPSEAITSASVEMDTLDLNHFLTHVAVNAPYAGIQNVVFDAAGAPVWVQASEHSLEDVVTHVLRNADRYRPAGSPITLTLDDRGAMAGFAIHNTGPAIDPERLESIFEYGVTDASAPGESRGQGLFVARTYMAKMGGTITAANANADGGVRFVLQLPRATPRASA
ncbi:MAG: HAMP domain-containing histidine kinase [Hydrogenophaga sp.]|uniref:sensor histidine kinase n=1 Tax=Hydrogenophaga sp. TaxID=1904254 RepID=UPI0025BC75F7|nr:HAMP domain-containing sensor histidine kinase [Hydrogenophaga sp.]MBT9551486.1 HAMP domain-containing histidine kinase [Hydrogenophaga sp.]